MPDLVVKTCFKCGLNQPLSCFYKHKAMADGHLGKCKACTKRDMLEHRRKNGDAIREYDRARSKLPHRIDLGYATSKAYRKRFPDRYRANSAVAKALKTGALVRQVCACCGSSDVESHHPDYSRPLDVIWLCPAHHKEIHLAYLDDHYENVHNPKQRSDWQSNHRPGHS